MNSPEILSSKNNNQQLALKQLVSPHDTIRILLAIASFADTPAHEQDRSALQELLYENEYCALSLLRQLVCNPESLAEFLPETVTSTALRETLMAELVDISSFKLFEGSGLKYGGLWESFSEHHYFVRDDIVPSSIVNRNNELTLTVTGSATASRFYGLTLRSHGPVNRWRGDDNFNMHLSSKDSKVNGTGGVQTCFSGRLNDNNTKESMHIEFSGDYLRSIDASPLEQDSTLILVVHPKMINEFEEQLVKRGLQNAFHREPYGAAEIDILVGDWVMQSEKDDSDRFLPITLKLLPTTHPEGATWSLPGMTPDSPLSDPGILIREKIQLLFQAFYLERPDHGPNEPQALTALYGVHMCARELPFNLLHVELAAAEHSLSITPDLSPYNVDLIQAQRLLKTVKELLPPFTCIPNTANCFPTLSDSSVLVEFGDKETIMKIYPLEYRDNVAKEFHWKDRSHYVGVVINENSQPLLVVTDEFAGKARELLRVEYVHNDEKRAMIPSMVIAESEADEQNLQIYLPPSPHRN